MKRIAFAAAGLAWLATGFALPCTASTRASDAPKPAVHADRSLASKLVAPRISEASARRIAWRSGMDYIEEITLAGDHWEVAGRDRMGNEKALDIHVEDGRILN